MQKQIISRDDLEHMDEFLKRDPIAFEAYAITDAIIPLRYAITLEEFNFTIKKVGVPITVSGLARCLVLEGWSEELAKNIPYQISGDCLMGNAHEIQTPRGLFATGKVGLYLNHFIANYKGGRNESFMYGAENDKNWFDYDLTSAYTTAMTQMSFPNYVAGSIISAEKVQELSAEELLSGYLIAHCEFKFPDDVKYPSIPVYIDKATTVYPLSGQAMLTGPEILLARNQKCSIKYISVFYIPPTQRVEKVGLITITHTSKPFHRIINELQAKRREYPKGHVHNALYKEMANSIYGNVVRGISNKEAFDTQTGKMLRVTGTELSNPILAS